MSDPSEVYLHVLKDYLGIDAREGFPPDKVVVFFICGFLFLIALWRMCFWKQNPVTYEAIVLLSGYGSGKLLNYWDYNNRYETASDIISVNTLYALMPIYVYTSTMDLHTTFGSYANIIVVLIMLAPIYIMNWLFISWVMFIVFGPALESTQLEMLIITLILSPIQVQYILDSLDVAQGRLAELKFKMRTECYSSFYLSFLIADITYKYSDMYVKGKLSMAYLVLFVFYQGLGVILGYIIAWAVQWSVQLAANHPPMCFAITFSAVFMITSWSMVLGTSTVLAVGVFGMMCSALVSRYCLESVEFYRQAWSLFLLLNNSMTVMLTGIIIGYTAQPKGISLFRVTLVFYCIFFFTRIILVMIFYPVVSKLMDFNVEWRYCALHVVGLYKGGPNYIMALNYAVLGQRNWYIVLLVVATNSLLSSIFNVLLIPMLLKIMGMFDYSAARIANMNVAMSHTNNCREKAIFALKMDKVVVDANWQVVEDVTQLSHPYKRFMNDSNFFEDIRDDRQIRSVICPDCKTEILAQPTKREIDSMKKEARERIIKSQQVSFHRQYETGALSTAEYDFLTGLVEAEMGASEPRLRPEKLKSRGIWVKTIIQVKRFLIWFRELTKETYSFIPINTIRFWCFQITISRSWRIMFALFVLLDTSLSIAQIIIYYFSVVTIDETDGTRIYFEDHYNFAVYAQYVHMILYGLNVLECTMSLSGLGFNQYFSRNVNKIEFACGIILGAIMIGITIHDSLEIGSLIHPFNYDIIILLKVFMWLRIVKLYILIIALVPRVIHKVDQLLTDEMMRNYEVGKAYLVALNRTATLLNRIVYSEDVYNVLMKEIDEDRMYISKELGMIQNENPSIATTIKTRHAIRFVINSMEDCIKDMREEGVVDMIEAEAIAESLDKNRMYLRGFSLISATPPEDILKNIPWLKDDSESLQYLLENAQLFSHDYGDVLFRAGEDPMGIHLVVSGLLKSQYVPSTTTLQLSAKFGVLPNYDFFNNVKFDQPQESFVVSGSIIGEIGAVSGRRYDMTVSCETAAQVYHIPFSIVKKVVHDSDDALKMQARIWKTICVKVALNILQYNVVSFQSWAPEKLLIYLNKGFVPVIPDMVGLTNSTRIEVIVLIEGIMMDKVNRKVYTGPCYIPRNVHDLIFPDHRDWDFQTICETRILIIPSNITNEEELKGPNGMFKYKTLDSPSQIRKEQDEISHRKVGFQEDDSSSSIDVPKIV